MPVNEPTEEEQVQNYVSNLYPKRYAGTGFLYHPRIITQMLEGVKFKDGKFSDKILDVGCGTGLVSRLYPNFDITGIDISDGMLSHNPYKWVKAPAEAIPFSDSTFDFVVCRSLLHHLDEPNLGLKEMFRVLKSGGTWVCWEPNHTWFNEIIRSIARLTPRFRHWHLNFQSSELQGMIKEAGFKITEVKYMGYIAYPLLGFPDIINFHIPLSIGKFLMWLDERISDSPFKKLGWAVMIKAAKNA